MNKLSADNPITMKELQRRLLLAPGTLTGLVDNLVNDGLVERWRDETDRRLVYLFYHLHLRPRCINESSHILILNEKEFLSI